MKRETREHAITRADRAEDEAYALAYVVSRKLTPHATYTHEGMRVEFYAPERMCGGYVWAWETFDEDRPPHVRAWSYLRFADWVRDIDGPNVAWWQNVLRSIAAHQVTAADLKALAQVTR